MPEGQRQKTKQLQYVYKENMQVVYTFPSLKKKSLYQTNTAPILFRTFFLKIKSFTF